MPRKKREPRIQFKVAAALDEIGAAQAILAKKRILRDVAKTARSWIRLKKAELKDLGYKGKIPRQTRVVGQVEYDRPVPKPEEDECAEIGAPPVKKRIAKKVMKDPARYSGQQRTKAAKRMSQTAKRA